MQVDEISQRVINILFNRFFPAKFFAPPGEEPTYDWMNVHAPHIFWTLVSLDPTIREEAVVEGFSVHVSRVLWEAGMVQLPGWIERATMVRTFELKGGTLANKYCMILENGQGTLVLFCWTRRRGDRPE